jgi:hypothetical protein
MVIAIILLCLFPGLATWLPDAVMGPHDDAFGRSAVQPCSSAAIAGRFGRRKDDRPIEGSPPIA